MDQDEVLFSNFYKNLLTANEIIPNCTSLVKRKWNTIYLQKFYIEQKDSFAEI